MLISDDLPTLERPMNAYSGRLLSGHLSTVELLIRNFALRIIIASWLDVCTKKMKIYWMSKLEGDAGTSSFGSGLMQKPIFCGNEFLGRSNVEPIIVFCHVAFYV